jgi:hypothetical protein
MTGKQAATFWVKVVGIRLRGMVKAVMEGDWGGVPWHGVRLLRSLGRASLDTLYRIRPREG